MIIKYQIKSAIGVLLLLLSFVILLYIVPKNFGSNFVTISVIVAIVVAFIWRCYEDGVAEEIRRLKTGYYKLGALFVCENCNQKVRVNFEKFLELDSLPRNEINIRVMNCPYCNGRVVLHGFDNFYKDYQEYMKEMKK